MADIEETALVIIGKLFNDGRINQAQNDSLKDMVFDEDTILLSFFQRFTEPNEQEELEAEVVKYANANAGIK